MNGHVHYETSIGWRLFLNGKPWGIFGWPSEWDCVRELRDRGFPGCARELEGRLYKLSLMF